MQHISDPCSVAFLAWLLCKFTPRVSLLGWRGVFYGFQLSCLRSALLINLLMLLYRLTLVKGWNMEEIANYAALLDLGKPDFIEIKGVTYCGSSGASSLTMQNVPYHADVCEFGEAICEARNGEYGLACEHAHSCCILLARKDRFWKDGRWHTWIDYDKFQVQFDAVSLNTASEGAVNVHAISPTAVRIKGLVFASCKQGTPHHVTGCLTFT